MGSSSQRRSDRRTKKAKFRRRSTPPEPRLGPGWAPLEHSVYTPEGMLEGLDRMAEAGRVGNGRRAAPPSVCQRVREWLAGR